MDLNDIQPRRILLVNPKFDEASLSFRGIRKVLRKKGLFPPLGLITVAALLPQQWEIRLVDVNTNAVSEDDWNWAETVLVGAMHTQERGLIALIREAKGRGKTVVAGGPLPTSAPDFVLDAGGDLVVRKEAENTIPLLAAALENGIKTQIIEVDEAPDMALSPIPRFDLIGWEDYAEMSIQTSRGCPFDCEFCDIVAIFGRTPRYKSHNQVLAELDVLFRLGCRGAVFICDDNFIGNRPYVRGLLRKIINWNEEHGSPFGFNTQTTIQLGQDPELIDLLTAANFGEVCVGIESVDEEALNIARKGHNIRNPLLESMVNINKNGLLTMGSFIIGLDGEKPGIGDRICAFVDDANISLPVIHTLKVAPDTRLWRRLKAEGRLSTETTELDPSGLCLNFVPSRPEWEIIDEYVRAWDYLYEPSRFLSRLHRSIMAMRPTRKAMAAQRGETLPSPAVPKAKIPFKQQWMDFVSFLYILWRLGLAPRYRMLFWRHLFSLMRNNPSRLKKYLIRCVAGLGFIHHRKTLKKLHGELRIQ